jgi:hypothetical protein
MDAFTNASGAVCYSDRHNPVKSDMGPEQAKCQHLWGGKSVWDIKFGSISV